MTNRSLLLPLGASTPFTIADIERTPEDGRRYELSNGILVVTPAAGVPHQVIQMNLVRQLFAHVEPDDQVLTDTDLRIRDDMLKRPDIQVVHKSLAVGPRITGVPSLVIEIASPSTAIFDRTEKRVAYAEAGIPSYWLVDPATETVTVLSLAGAEYVEVEPPAWLDVAAVFAT